MSKFEYGVITGEDVQKVFMDAKLNKYALPAVNVTNTSTVNSVMETAAELNSPAIIQFSNGGGSFFAGKHLDNTNQKAAISGCISGAYHVHLMAKEYEVNEVLKPYLEKYLGTPMQSYGWKNARLKMEINNQVSIKYTSLI